MPPVYPTYPNVRPLGKHIAVFGHTGSGKSTVAHRIGESLGSQVIDLDRLFWRDGWQPAPLEEFRGQVATALHQYMDGWVTAGNYSQARDIVLAEADSAVWLLLPLRVSFWRLLQRTVKRASSREALWGTANRESWRRSFLSKDSILLWALTHHKEHIRSMRTSQEASPHVNWVTLSSVKQVERFLVELHP